VNRIPDAGLNEQFPAHQRSDGKEAFNNRRPYDGDNTVARGLVNIDEKLKPYPDGGEKYAQLKPISFSPCMGFTVFLMR